MEIHVNGCPTSLPNTGASLIDLISILELTNERLAIELNQSVIPKRDWAITNLKPNDRVEIVHFVGGG